MPAALVNTMASAVESPMSSPIELTKSGRANGRHDSFKPKPLRDQRTPTYAKAGDVFPKKRALSSSLERIKPLFSTKPQPTTEPEEHPRISRPVELIDQEYDVVVIGSGYGGGVAASRMARAGQKVCVLELGREKWPGEYPEDLEGAKKQLHLSGQWFRDDNAYNPIAKGDPTSLYQLIFGKEQNAFVAHGLGGTSLLNANVFLEADPKTMAMSSWPDEIQNDPTCLEPYYKRAREMLEPKPYPDDWPSLPKMETLRKQAEALKLGNKFRKVEQTTRFEDGLNSSGVDMKKSTLTGMDTTGLNDKSKSSTLVNYLSDAWNWGAEIFCACEVRSIAKHPKGGYKVFFAWHGCRRHKFKDMFYHDLMWVHAKKFVFLGAGALGSTEILLRSKEMGLDMSEQVGQHMSGNGDMFAFGYNMNETVRSMGNPKPPLDEPVGPTITSIIDCRDQEDPLDGFVIEEGAVAEPLVRLLQPLLELTPHKSRSTHLSRGERLQKLMSRASSVIGCYSPKGSLERTQVYLIMSHDDNQATLTLKDNKPSLEFLGVGRAEHVQRLTAKLQEATESQGGLFVDNPFSSVFDQEVTVHPIGGASMSSDNSMHNGVTNHLGQVLTGENGEVHDGLVVVDGSIVPTSLGANPFATITALAERSVHHLAERSGLTIDYDTKNGPLNFFGEPEHPRPDVHVNKSAEFVRQALIAKKHSLEFTEIMTGHIHIGSNVEDFELAERVARGNCEEARFFLSVHAYDADTFLTSDQHDAMLTGTFTSGALPNSPYMVTGGNFQLFNNDPDTPDTKNLTYDFNMVGTDGSRLHFKGKKIINDLATFSISGTWKATTTLMVTLTDPDSPEDGNVVGRGILYIDPYDFLRELKTFYSSMSSTKQFLAYFVKELAHVFFAPLDYLDWPQCRIESWSQKNKPLRVFDVTAIDGEKTILKMWEPLEGKKERDMDLFFIPGAAVDETIFALDTLPEESKNAITYFRELGYRCFCLVHRVGKTPIAQKGYTTYEARLDVAAAIEKIEALRHSAGVAGQKPYGPLRTQKTYIIAHCAGSIALSMGLLDGTVNTSSIAGITASQVFMHPTFATVNHIKASLPIPLPNVYSLMARSKWFDCVSTPTDTFVQLGLNQLLRLYPPPSKSDICKSVVCHRSSLVFGMLWKHENLSPETHRELERFVGGTSMRSLKHLMSMGTKGKVLTSQGDDNLVTDENLERLRGIPIYLFSGTDNSVYDPVTTMTSYSYLRDRFGVDNYSRDVIPDYGHLDCWMGKEAYKDVFPKVRDHIEGIPKMAERRERHAAAMNGLNGTHKAKPNGHAS